MLRDLKKKTFTLLEKAIEIFGKKNYHPKKLIIQAGGIDCTTMTAPEILRDYKLLVQTISGLCPFSEIIMAEIPPRFRTAKGPNHRFLNQQLTNRIRIMNISLRVYSEGSGLNTSFMSAAPKSELKYMNDGVHFTEEGKMDYAMNVISFIDPTFQEPMENQIT